MLRRLESHARTLYPRIARSGERLRRGIERVCAEAGVEKFVMNRFYPLVESLLGDALDVLP